MGYHGVTVGDNLHEGWGKKKKVNIFTIVSVKQ